MSSPKILSGIVSIVAFNRLSAYPHRKSTRIFTHLFRSVAYERLSEILTQISSLSPVRPVQSQYRRLIRQQGSVFYAGLSFGNRICINSSQKTRIKPCLPRLFCRRFTKHIITQRRVFFNTSLFFTYFAAITSTSRSIIPVASLTSQPE